MNSNEIQNEINEIIKANHKTIGGRSARKQFPIGKAQQATLESLGILDMVPNAPYSQTIGFSDAKAIIEAAQDAGGKWQGNMHMDDGSMTTASNLYTLLNAPDEPEAITHTITMDQHGGSQHEIGDRK